MASLIGQRLAQYEVIALLGGGGMATVYRARQLTIQRDVAIKVIKADLADVEGFGKRFEQEARTIARLGHPYIVKLFDYGQHRDTVYLVMELLTGGSLDSRIKAGPLALDTIERILDQLASALSYAHHEGILHRDLKPQNVLLDAHSNAILTDFGIAKLLYETTGFTQEGMQVGTPAYMSPEHWRGQPLGPQADIYALGIILFEMLTGRLPYSATTLHTMMYQHLQDTPPSVLSIRPDLPLGMDSIITRAMSKNPAERFETALALSAAFKAVQQGKAGTDLSPDSATVIAFSPVVWSSGQTDTPTTIDTVIETAPDRTTDRTTDSTTDSAVNSAIALLGLESDVKPVKQAPSAAQSAAAPAGSEKVSNHAGPVLLQLVGLALALATLIGSGDVSLRFLRAGAVSLTTGLAIGLAGVGAAVLPLAMLYTNRFRPFLARLPWPVWFIPLILQLVLGTAVIAGRMPFLDAYTNDLQVRSQQAAQANQSRQATDLLLALARLNPDQAHSLANDFNDKGATANSTNDLVHAHTYLEAVHALDTDETLDVGRSKVEKGTSRYNLGFLRESESNPDGALAAYREAIQLDDGQLEARYGLSSLLLINASKDIAALDEAVNVANLGWKNYIPETFCRSAQNLADRDTFRNTWYCFTLLTTEAGARLARHSVEKGDTPAEIQSLSRRAVNLAEANGNFRQQGYSTAEAYYYLARATEPAVDRQILCGILANLDIIIPRHRPWADYANAQLKSAGATCTQ